MNGQINNTPQQREVLTSEMQDKKYEAPTRLDIFRWTRLKPAHRYQNIFIRYCELLVSVYS